MLTRDCARRRYRRERPDLDREDWRAMAAVRLAKDARGAKRQIRFLAARRLTGAPRAASPVQFPEDFELITLRAFVLDDFIENRGALQSKYSFDRIRWIGRNPSSERPENRFRGFDGNKPARSSLLDSQSRIWVMQDNSR